MPMEAIKATDIKFGYETEKEVLHGVSFQVPAGSYVSIIGHNGSGKSTLAKLIIGLLEAQSGSIEIFKEKLSEDTVNEIRRRVGIVFQNPDNQFIGATVRDDIAFGLENRAVEREKMDAIINNAAHVVGMEDFLEKEPTNLSGGQKQRVAIAGVIAMNPDIVIFDEATAMLDPRGKKEIHQVIAKMRDNHPNLTILSITHDIEEAYLSDYILVLSGGNVLLEGSPDEVFSQEEILLKNNLDIPFFYKMKKSLIEQGIDVSNISNLEGLVEYLCR